MIITGITALLFGIIMAVPAVLFLNGKCVELIAGYNAMTEEEKKSSAPTIARMNGRTLMAVAVLTLIYAAVSVISAFEMLSAAVFVAATVICCALFILTVTVSVIRYMKKNILIRRTQDEKIYFCSPVRKGRKASLPFGRSGAGDELSDPSPDKPDGAVR